MKLLFGADLVPRAATERNIIDKNHKTVWGDVSKIVKQYDRFIVNLECALTEETKEIKKFGPGLKASPLCADSFKDFGVTDAMLANNHVYDFGEKGLRDTVANLERVGIGYSGVGENDEDSRKIYYIEDGSVKVAIINVCEHEYSYALKDRFGTNPYVPFKTIRDVKEAKKNADYVIVIYHGGKEFSKYPSPRLLEHMREMVLSGASVVLTQHSHCIGCYEEYEGGHILYGQGNLNFVQKSMGEGWYDSLLVGVELEGGDVKVNFYPIVMKEDGVDLATGDKKEEILRDFAKRNEELKTGEWEKGWDAFCKKQEGTYRYMLSPQYAIDFKNEEQGEQVKAHFLDCEAHLDVMKHIFKSWHLD